jgi:branched-chain amino acid transport system ATP-binding protein
MLDITHIDVDRGETQVLWDVSLSVSAGERVAILGGNGAGKSTLMAAVTGLLAPRNGDIQFEGESIAGKKPSGIARMGISMVPEGRRVYGDMTVAENLEIGAYPKRARDRMAKTLEEIFALFPVLADRRHQRAATLSGGEQQMLAIGRALMNRPRLLLLDELSLGLAPLITREIYRSLSALGQEITVLLVEQNVELALQNSERAYIMENGRLGPDRPSADLMADPAIRKAYLGMA